MRRHAKASSAESSLRGGSPLGRIVRGPFATAYGSDVDGSGAPISGRLRRRFFLALHLTVIVSVLGMGVGVSGASAVQPLSTIGIIGKCCHEGVLGEYYYANSLDINKKTGDLYLLDPNDSHVLVFDSNGNYKFTFGSEGTGAGQLGKYSSVGISVDQTSGDVYVSESGGPLANNRISKFSETGEFILTFGRRVNETTLGDVCTKASGDVCQPGTTEGERAIVNSIAAVDPDTGNVYIPTNGKTSIYAPNGKYIETIETPGVVNQIAIFNEIIYQQTSTGFKTYSDTGNPLGEIVVPAFQEFSPVGMVPAPGTEQPGETHLYVMMINNATGKTEVGEFNSSGKLLIEHGIGMPYPTQGSIAVDPSIPHIYVGTFPNDPVRRTGDHPRDTGNRSCGGPQTADAGRGEKRDPEWFRQPGRYDAQNVLAFRISPGRNDPVDRESAAADRHRQRDNGRRREPGHHRTDPQHLLRIQAGREPRIRRRDDHLGDRESQNRPSKNRSSRWSLRVTSPTPKRRSRAWSIRRTRLPPITSNGERRPPTEKGLRLKAKVTPAASTGPAESSSGSANSNRRRPTTSASWRRTQREP